MDRNSGERSDSVKRMTQAKFLSKWHDEKTMYEAWGWFVTETIKEYVRNTVETDPSYFFRIPPMPRLKDDNSLIDKAFYRSKPYKHPYDDITDKVGTRFVLLTTEDIAPVSEAVNQSDKWSASKDRDYELEIERDPTVFQYSAVHFVVRNAIARRFQGIEIAEGIACEVQIKTILQHAYSELTHDSIYKPKVDATPSMHRAAAKSSALIEATNDYFIAVKHILQELIDSDRHSTESNARMYRHYVGVEPTPTGLEGLLVKNLIPLLDGTWEEELNRFLASNRRIGKVIAEKAASSLLHRQPSVLLVYYLVENKGELLRQNWPLTVEELRSFFTDLGMHLSDSPY